MKIRALEILRNGMGIYMILFMISFDFRPVGEGRWLKLEKILGPLLPKGPEIVPAVFSDSTLMYFSILILLVLSILLSLIFSVWIKKILDQTKLQSICYWIFCAYVSFVLFHYGLNKIFLLQFKFPTSNLIYSHLGDLSKDILFWSTMGTSPLYQITTGCIEILAGVLVFSSRTRFIGLNLSLLTFLHIVLINFSFDISVKLFTLHLLALNVFLLVPYFSKYLELVELKRLSLNKNSLVKFTLLVAMLLMVGLPYSKVGSYSNTLFDEIQGAYMIEDNTSSRFEKMAMAFIHSDGFLIFQDQWGNKQDFELFSHPQTDLLIFEDVSEGNAGYVVHVSEDFIEVFARDSIEKLMTLYSFVENDLPIYDSGFHWTIDSYFLED